METEIRRGDIIQVPREALHFGLDDGDLFGVVVSSHFLAQKANQYVVALIAPDGENPEIEVEITEGTFRRQVVTCSLLVNVLEEQLAALPSVNRVRDKLSKKDLRTVGNLLRRILDLRSL